MPTSESRGSFRRCSASALRASPSCGRKAASIRDVSPGEQSGLEAPRIWTIGHSTRTAGEFLELLDQHGIQGVADVRRYPGSRRMPQFGKDALAATLQARGLEYLWLPGLGGRRNPLPDSPNTAWRSPAFRGYADYLETEAFAESLAELISMACGVPTAVMCAEAVWWRCHRGLIADVLRWLGFEVMHILGPGSPAPHPYTAAAHLAGGRLSYAAREDVDSGASQTTT